MTDSDEPRAWEFGEHRLTVLPDITWDEWLACWGVAERMQKSSPFYVGDALLAGQARFGEEFAQVVDPKYIHQQRGPMWVCGRIEPPRRRAGLSYSLHREVAALDREAQERWLTAAEDGGWTVALLKEAMERERRSAWPANGEPDLGPVSGDPRSTWNRPGSLEAATAGRWPDDDTFGSPEEIDGPRSPRARPEGAEDGTAATTVAETRFIASVAPPSGPAEALRGAIAAVRAVAEAAALDQAPVSEMIVISAEVERAVGYEVGPNALQHTDAALALVPVEWSEVIRIAREDGIWTVALCRGDSQVAMGAGPHLPSAVVEAALSARLSDLGQG